jgi:AbiV family abortive infection protein
MTIDEIKIKQFTGRLTPSQIAEGCNLATNNAMRLVGDAKLLLDAGRFSTAASLAILAIEESGKHGILRYLAMAEDDKELKEAWKYYRTHTKKNRLWALPIVMQNDAQTIFDIGKKLFDENNEYAAILNQIRQLGFYTDCVGNGRWISPEDLPQRIAVNIVSIAEWLAKKDPISSKEIELWIEHMRPIWKKHEEVAGPGLLKWFKALQKEGLFPKDINMERFIISQGKDPNL